MGESANQPVAPAAPAAAPPAEAAAKPKKQAKVVMTKKAFLDDIVREAVKTCFGDTPVRFSRPKAAVLWSELQRLITERAAKGPFSVRGYGSFYQIVGKPREGKAPNRYLSTRLKLRNQG